jgi:hypothetical protein
MLLFIYCLAPFIFPAPASVHPLRSSFQVKQKAIPFSDMTFMLLIFNFRSVAGISPATREKERVQQPHSLHPEFLLIAPYTISSVELTVKGKKTDSK